MITFSDFTKFFDVLDPGHEWKCVAEGSEIENVRQDRKSAVMIEGYDISEKAVYFNGRYLPLSQIKSVRRQPSTIRIKGGGCIGIPVFKIRLDYGAAKPVVLIGRKRQCGQDHSNDLRRESRYYGGILCGSPHRIAAGKNIAAFILKSSN